MSMTQELPDAEVIELEPTIHLDLADPQFEGAPMAPRRSGAVAMMEGTLASLSGETGTLRRRRLAAAALMLAAVYATLFAWNRMTTAHILPLIWQLMASRFLLSSAVLGLLLSPIANSARVVRALEVLLFGGLTAILVASQYFVNLQLMRGGDLPGVVAFVKNGVIQMIVLMMILGTLIPNRPKTVAWAVLVMALSPLLGFTLLTETPEVAGLVDEFQTVEQTGSNALFLVMGAGIAVFSSAILNGLRAQLHEARKFGQYHLVRKLGAGGMGEVYLAEHSLLKRPCALKLIKPEAGADPLALARFEREVQSSARLSHHNTIEIYDYGHTEDGTFYYVMEYLKGMSLGDLVKEHGPLPAGRVIYLFRQVCAGLAEAHGLGLVHRDLKPANVFVAIQGGETDVAKVLDFGLVKVSSEPDAVALTAEFTVSGTPLYMAPEQAVADRSLDARADIYALGAMMYHALTGQPPFQGESAFAVMMAHSRDLVVPPSEVRADVPHDLEVVVLRCLAKKPADRYQDVKDLGEALSRCDSAADWGPRIADEWWKCLGATPLASPPAPSA